MKKLVLFLTIGFLITGSGFAADKGPQKQSFLKWVGSAITGTGYFKKDTQNIEPYQESIDAIARITDKKYQEAAQTVGQWAHEILKRPENNDIKIILTSTKDESVQVPVFVNKDASKVENLFLDAMVNKRSAELGFNLSDDAQEAWYKFLIERVCVELNPTKMQEYKDSFAAALTIFTGFSAFFGSYFGQGYGLMLAIDRSGAIIDNPRSINAIMSGIIATSLFAGGMSGKYVADSYIRYKNRSIDIAAAAKLETKTLEILLGFIPGKCEVEKSWVKDGHITREDLQEILKKRKEKQ